MKKIKRKSIYLGVYGIGNVNVNINANAKSK